MVPGIIPEPLEPDCAIGQEDEYGVDDKCGRHEEGFGCQVIENGIKDVHIGVDVAAVGGIGAVVAWVHFEDRIETENNVILFFSSFLLF